MNNKHNEVSCLTGWSANEPEENLTPKVSIAAEKMLRTSKLYLKVDQTKTGSDSSRPAKTDPLSATPTHQ
jgi:hypothetical protein